MSNEWKPYIIVTLLSVLVGFIIWGSFFSMRVISTINSNAASYTKAKLQHLLCLNNATIDTGETVKDGFPDVCEVAKTRVAVTLFWESFFATWENSTVCGGATCFAQIFGKDETLTSVLLRTTLLATGIGVICFIAWRTIIIIEHWTTPTNSKKKNYSSSTRKADKPLYILPNVEDVTSNYREIGNKHEKET